MTTLTSAPVADLLARLYAQATATTSPLLEQTPAAEVDRLMRSKTEYRQLYGSIKELWLPVGQETGTLLYVLARLGKARTLVEFGTSFGISTLHLAAALRDNGGGQLITTEFEPTKVAQARAHLEAGGLLDLVELRCGDALETLARDLPPRIDLVLLDGAKALYNDILSLVESHLSPGALILADNVDFCPDYLARVRSPANGYLSIPLTEEVELSWKIS